MAGNSRGARLEVNWDMLDLDVSLLSLGNKYDLLSQLSQSVVGQTKERFESKRAPDGHEWVGRSPAYLKTNPPGSTLVRGGFLKDTITDQIYSPEVAVVGSKLSYAKVHQYGGKGEFNGQQINIPARPYLGVSRENKATLRKIAEVWIRKAVS